ncbi:hypothetical protein ACFW2T_33055 [Streptomyces sp. NPDC058892]|uniref:recombination directionality factor n=1 Tax=Streptomyces sp. NPDC058892 TaxID=3346668 RepID=UPI0036D1017B
MGSRILTMKRQAAELGRIRTGYSRPNPKPAGRPIPVKSKTFVLSSHSRAYVERAAALYGGNVEEWTPQNQKTAQYRVITTATELRAVLPAGDPLSQAYELWSGGGCARRCDGETEQLSRKPCLCRAKFGPDWHEQNEVKQGSVCKPTSRIGVFLPDLPDLGVWRLESKSHYAADVMAGGIDTVLQATGGKGLMPVRMWIEHREIMRAGKPKHFPVVMVVPSLPTLRQALSGPLSTAAALDPSGVDRRAIEAPRPDYAAEARGCRTVEDARAVWHRANRAGHVARDGSDELSQELRRIADDIAKGIDTSTGELGDDQDDDGFGQDDDIVDDEPPADTTGEACPEVAQPGGGAR